MLYTTEENSSLQIIKRGSGTIKNKKKGKGE